MIHYLEYLKRQNQLAMDYTSLITLPQVEIPNKQGVREGRDTFGVYK
jgi:hypothetical protein